MKRLLFPPLSSQPRTTVSARSYNDKINLLYRYQISVQRKLRDGRGPLTIRKRNGCRNFILDGFYSFGR